MYSKETQKELFERQLIICGQGDDIPDLLGEINEDTKGIDEALIDDSLANFLYLLLHGKDEAVLDLLAYTRTKFECVGGILCK